jgi:cell division protein FtsL
VVVVVLVVIEQRRLQDWQRLQITASKLEQVAQVQTITAHAVQMA